MELNRLSAFRLITLMCLLVAGPVLGQNEAKEKHLEVALRMVGHQLLLQSGDSSSRVLPIEKEKSAYTIRFENQLMIHPDSLNQIVEQTLRKTKIAQGYFVEVKRCADKQVVYSYEIGYQKDKNLVPCSGRVMPKACYEVSLTLVYWKNPYEERFGDTTTTNKNAGNSFYSILILGVFALFFVLILRWRVKKNRANSPWIIIGKFAYNIKSAKLFFEKKEIELTAKEADLLLLLNASRNETVERDVLLNKVWGDEGDYVGRTLDVFISKLRKILESDPNVKIVNVRGVGYKLVVGE